MESKKEASGAPKPPSRADPLGFGDEHYRKAQDVLTSYLLERSEVFRRLSELQEQGWKSAEGDEFFRKQRERADRPSHQTEKFFFNMMRGIGKEMHEAVGAFNINPPNHATPRILDMCAAPGGLLSIFLDVHDEAEAVAFTLPVAAGGHRMRMWPSQRVRMTYVDITMLAGDLGLGAADIPPDHPDRGQFVLERLLPVPPAPEGPEREGDEDEETTGDDAGFDLALCDGQVLRTQARAAYREAREAGRLTASQLALALARLRRGGTLVVLLHKAGAWGTAQLLWTASRFAETVRLFKPRAAHAARSSFYLVAAGVHPRCAAARAAVRRWSALWRAATLNAADGDAYVAARRDGAPDVHTLLADFGPRLIELATPVWEIQTRALAKAPFMKRE